MKSMLPFAGFHNLSFVTWSMIGRVKLWGELGFSTSGQYGSWILSGNLKTNNDKRITILCMLFLFGTTVKIWDRLLKHYK